MHALVLQEFPNTTTDYTIGRGGAVIGSGLLVLLISLSLAVAVFNIAAMWKVFTKAGEPGWHAIVPILNTYTLVRVAKRPGWWLLLMLIPCISFVVMIIVMMDLAKAFNKSSGFGLGLIFLSPIFMAILAFGPATYDSSSPYGFASPYLPGSNPGVTGGWGAQPGQGGQGAWGQQAQPGQGGQGAWGQQAQQGQGGQGAWGQQAQQGQSAWGEQAQQGQSAWGEQAQQAEPGWYPDPTGSGQRWWDGNAWTEHRSE